MDIIQVGLLGITAVFLALFIKNYKSEYSILISTRNIPAVAHRYMLTFILSRISVCSL